MGSKLNVGIDINEVFRAKWLQFDRFYVQEFGDEGVPKTNPYMYDLFNSYEWKDKTEEIKELKEPEDMPNDITPLDYQLDNNTGESKADYILFKKPEKNHLPAKEVYNRFMYEDYVFEIHASAPIMYKGMDLHVNNFHDKYQNSANFTLLSVENKYSIPPTLFFLSKMISRFRSYQFVNKSLDMWNHVDLLITSDPEILKLGKPWGKNLIKVRRPYNENIKFSGLEILQINDLIGNKDFEKIIKYKK